MPNRDTRNGVDAYWDEETGEVIWPLCVGCANYFNEGPCETCPPEEE